MINPQKVRAPPQRIHTEWQRPLSGVHSVMMVKSAQPGEGGECTPSPCHSIYHHEQFVVYPPAEREIHSPISPLPLLYSLANPNTSDVHTSNSSPQSIPIGQDRGLGTNSGACYCSWPAKHGHPTFPSGRNGRGNPTEYISLQEMKQG